MPRTPKTPFINRILSKRDKLQAGVVEDLLLEVAEERDLLEVIFDSMVEGVIATDHHGKVIFFNSAAQTLFSLQEEAVLGRDIRELLPQGELRDRIAQAIDSGERVYESELRVEVPVERLLRMNIIPLIARLERFFGTVILVIDITERKANEARLEQAEKLAAQTTLSAGIA
ncbi:MAG TPA: PAS domain S-box protein, partial [Firmicutes bacterium]|nr:PAS domain S-box protein [Bacillota bacterium]